MTIKLISKNIDKRKFDCKCLNCNIYFKGVKASKFCTERCKVVYTSKQKYTGTEGHDYLICPVCSQHVVSFTLKHLKMHGFDSYKEFQTTYNLKEIVATVKKLVTSGEGNGAYQHGGLYSKFSKNFLHGYDEEWNKNHVEDIKKNRKAHPEKYKNNIKYWIEKNNGNEDLAKEQYLKFQTKNLQYFIELYGEVEGPKRHKAKTDKWMKSFKKTNFSMISQELFNSIMEKLNIDKSGIYYATHERDDKTEYQNKEFRANLSTTTVSVDFIDINTKKVIEFDGEYWHNRPGVKERDLIRDTNLLEAGYQILHVKELEYKQDKEKVISECITYLTM